MKAQNSDLQIIDWESNENKFKPGINIKISVQPKGETIPSEPRSKTLQFKWKCSSTEDKEPLLDYLSEDSFKVHSTADFTPKQLGQALFLSFKRVRDEFNFRTSHLGNFEFKVLLTDDMIMEFFRTLKLGK